MFIRSARSRPSFLGSSIETTRSFRPPISSGTWWDNNGAVTSCIGAWQAKGAASLAASYTDLSGHSADLTLGVAPNWATGTGWSFTGTQYLITGLFWYQNYTALIRCANTGSLGINETAIGSISGTGQFLFIKPRTPRFQNGTSQLATSGGGNGVLGLANSDGFRDGTDLGDITLGSAVTYSHSLWIGGLNNGGTLANALSTSDVLAAAVYNATLSGAQISAISTLMAAL